MTRRKSGNLTLRGPLPTIPGAAELGIRVTYPTNAPDGWTVALLRLPNDYYVVPGTQVEDPREVKRDPVTGVAMPNGIKWRWTDGRGISSVLRALAPLDRTPVSCKGITDA